MKTKKSEILTIALFVGFLTAMLAMYLVLPKPDFSEQEKRNLAEAPKLSWEALASGELGEDIETYMADHIPGRDFFVGLNAYFELLTGRQWGKDIYRLPDGRLVEAPVQWDPAAVEKNMKAINGFAQKLGRPVDLMLVPSAGWASGEYPELYRDEDMIRDIYGLGEGDLRTVDLLDTYRDRRELYFKTDHHWNSRGAYEGYAAYRQFLGCDFRAEGDFTITDQGLFRGSTYSRSALWLTPGEPLELWQGSGGITVSNGETEGIHEGVFYWERLKEADKYTVNLDGNHSVVRIHNPGGEGRLLVVRDSYANSLGTFLAESWEEAVLVDLRYYKEPISKLAQDESFDDVLICYSIGNFMKDANIIWLR